LSEQPPDTWDSFPLFQVLNDYLRMDGKSICNIYSFIMESLNPNFTFLSDNLKNGRFHHQLQTIFAPLVVRYVDLMESSIAQSIHKGFEKERWEIKG
jgi:calcium-dependent secretion activator